MSINSTYITTLQLFFSAAFCVLLCCCKFLRANQQLQVKEEEEEDMVNNPPIIIESDKNETGSTLTTSLLALREIGHNISNPAIIDQPTPTHRRCDTRKYNYEPVVCDKRTPESNTTLVEHTPVVPPVINTVISKTTANTRATSKKDIDSVAVYNFSSEEDDEFEKKQAPRKTAKMTKPMGISKTTANTTVEKLALLPITDMIEECVRDSTVLLNSSLSSCRNVPATVTIDNKRGHKRPIIETIEDDSEPLKKINRGKTNMKDRANTSITKSTGTDRPLLALQVDTVDEMVELIEDMDDNCKVNLNSSDLIENAPEEVDDTESNSNISINMPVDVVTDKTSGRSTDQSLDIQDCTHRSDEDSVLRTRSSKSHEKGNISAKERSTIRRAKNQPQKSRKEANRKTLCPYELRSFSTQNSTNKRKDVERVVRSTPTKRKREANTASNNNVHSTTSRACVIRNNQLQQSGYAELKEVVSSNLKKIETNIQNLRKNKTLMKLRKKIKNGVNKYHRTIQQRLRKQKILMLKKFAEMEKSNHNDAKNILKKIDTEITRVSCMETKNMSDLMDMKEKILADLRHL
ncbi:uncharacterized protein LOC112045508 isoform X3 [Bicyclus anynana]|uniref:Uncharacterized protein LOC112045508 isoform X3 n=2 Tax=Bicyclus anynana TaxID=110368 RepID=A0ABM3M675_BICAN|nr:uncharacterized protein LOC112045508 isoform X3 [Bicyclus anynana]